MIGKTNALAGMKQKQEMVNISLSSNQVSHDDLVGAVITLSYGEYSEEIVWDGSEVTRAVPAFVEYTVSFGDVENHKTPAAVSYTAVDGNSRTVVGTYLTELVSVTLSADDGASMAGQIVTINGKEHTFDGNAVEQKVAYGVTYTVSASAKDGYATPEEQTFTAAQSARNLALTYVASALKVSILSNQTNDTTIAAVKATVAYGGVSVEVASGETIEMPSGVEGTVTFPEVEGYKTPDVVAFTHESGLTEISGTYQTEMLIVNVSSDNGQVSGYEITIAKQELVGVATKYTKLEYIEATGTQYVDTGIVVNKSDSYRMELLAYFTNDVYGGCNGYMQFKSGIALNKKAEIVVDYSSNVENIYVDGTLNNTDDWTSRYSETDVKLGLLKMGDANNGWYTDSPQTGKLYGCKIYSGSTLVRDFIPALRSDGIAGLYESVGDSFYTSVGSGNFIAGSMSAEVIATQTSVTGTYKVAHGLSYMISANNVSGYDKPSTQYFTASETSRVVSVVYEERRAGTLNPTNGVYIQDTDGYCYTADEWDGTYTPNGIALITDVCSFVIALESRSTTYSWSVNQNLVSDIPTSETSSVMLSYFSGKDYTDQILSQEGGAQYTPAAGTAKAYVFPNGKEGYLGSLGEWNAAFNNYSAINSAFNTCGYTFPTGGYWTSSQYNYKSAWSVYYYTTFGHYTKDTKLMVRPFTTL